MDTKVVNILYETEQFKCLYIFCIQQKYTIYNLRYRTIEYFELCPFDIIINK